ncbi:hypothetical protein JTE90_020620 [Oedothorax gibbosus]|uniref:Uncharacterized protein n=1 Tax=Oedothorax gibbosus TaxID=931172 RepID=A0AAV6TTV6_9ARAC|nr:hypothetical protein JTE90_020620 [Oedothorax gibbosus]
MNDDDYRVYRKWMSLWWTFGKTNIACPHCPIRSKPISFSHQHRHIREKHASSFTWGTCEGCFYRSKRNPAKMFHGCFLSVSNAWHLYRCGVKLLNANGVDTTGPCQDIENTLQRECCFLNCETSRNDLRTCRVVAHQRNQFLKSGYMPAVQELDVRRRLKNKREDEDD